TASGQVALVPSQLEVDRDPHGDPAGWSEFSAALAPVQERIGDGIAQPLDCSSLTPSISFMPNPVVRWQLISPDPEKTAKFYQKLFEWKLSTANPLGYRELSAGTP